MFVRQATLVNDNARPAILGYRYAIESTLALPPEQRITDITNRLADVRRELAAPIFQGSPQARALGDQIETFTCEAVASALHGLTG